MVYQPSRAIDAHRSATPPAIRVQDLARARDGAQRPARQQMRRYEVRALTADGGIAESRHVAPALPLFEDAFCAFARGCLIDTDQGQMAVEDLLPGDRLLTAEGEALPVLWIGSTALVPGHRTSAGRLTNLTRITDSAFGPARPGVNLVVGPSARLLHTPPHLRGLPESPRMLTPVAAYQDGDQVFETVPPTAVQTYHLCLARHAVIRLSGLEFETYHPGTRATRNLSPVMREMFLGLFPHIDTLSDFGLLAHPRARTEDGDDATAA